MSDQPTSETPFSPMEWVGGADGVFRLLDQTQLPARETWLDCTQPEQVADAIRILSVRGAPAIGVSAAYGLVLGMRSADDETLDGRFEEVYRLLGETRPTAVNLRWALDHGRQVFESHRAAGAAAVTDALLHWAHHLHREDIATNRRIGDHGSSVFEKGDRVLTHCNAGALATAGYGTAVGVITSAHRDGKVEQVWVDETRPLLQGARLTAWELGRLDIPHRLVTDSSVGALMARGLVDRVVTGADRIAMNGDTANKIGTYVVAALAHRHGVPFYVAAPRSTIDPRSPSGEAIPIEERAAEEVTRFGGPRVAPDSTEATNFAFDVTPHELIAGIITEVGVLRPPFEVSIRRALDGE